MLMTNLPFINPISPQKGQQGEVWIEFIKETLKILIPFAAGYFAHFLQSRRENRGRIRREKDTFAVFIRQKIGVLPERRIEEFYNGTKPEIRDAIHRICVFLPSETELAIDRLWKEYDEIPADKLSGENEPDYVKEIMELDGGEEFRPPRDIVAHYLDEFYKFAK